MGAREKLNTAYLLGSLAGVRGRRADWRVACLACHPWSARWRRHSRRRYPHGRAAPL